MKSMLAIALLLAGSIGIAQAQSMTQREAYLKMAEVYEAAGMYDLARQARQMAENLNSEHSLPSDRVEPARQYTRPTPSQQPQQPSYRSRTCANPPCVIRAD